MRFYDYAGGWFGSIAHLRPSTREKVAGHLRAHILPAFGDVRIGEISPSDVRVFISDLSASGLAPGTVVAVYRTFAGIMRRATIEDVIPRSPCIGIDLPRDRRAEMHFLTAEEVARLADAIDPRYRTLVYFAAYSGARWGEVAALKVECLNLLRGTVTLAESLSEVNGYVQVGPTKTGGSRSVSLPRFLCEMLGEHLRRFPSTEGYVFSAAEGGPLRRSWYRRHFQPATAHAGLPHRFKGAQCTGCTWCGLPVAEHDGSLRFHDLRHTCVALLIGQGAHAKEIAERLGHSTVRLSLDRYGHLLPSLDERLREGLEETYQAAVAVGDVDQVWTKRGPTPIRETDKGPG
jgi:integrase